MGEVSVTLDFLFCYNYCIDNSNYKYKYCIDNSSNAWKLFPLLVCGFTISNNIVGVGELTPSV